MTADLGGLKLYFNIGIFCICEIYKTKTTRNNKIAASAATASKTTAAAATIAAASTTTSTTTTTTSTAPTAAAAVAATTTATSQFAIAALLSIEVNPIVHHKINTATERLLKIFFEEKSGSPFCNRG